MSEYPSERCGFPDTDDFIRTIESWIIDRYSPNSLYFEDMKERLDYDEEEFKKFGQDKEPDYIIRLLPWLFDEFTEEDGDYDLDLSKFEDIFLILNIFTFFDGEINLPNDENYRYIYFQMSLKVCEWLTTEESVMKHFNQKKEVEKYTTAFGIKSQRIIFDYEKYLESIWAHSKGLLLSMMEEISGPFGPIDFNDLDKESPEKRTILLNSINEWFKIIKITESSIESIIGRDKSSGVYSHGFTRYSKIDPRYRLMIYSSLIRQIYTHNSQSCLIFNANTKNRLRELIKLGQECLDDRNKKFLDFDHWFSEDDVIYEFQMLSQTSSLFLQPNTVEIFHHCSLMEKMQSHWDVWESINGCFERSIATKLCVVMSSLDKDAQDKFKGMITSISPGSIHKTINSDEIEKLPGVEWRDLQLNGLLLKKSFEGIIGGIKPDIGKSVIKRLKYFQFWKENHISLYNQLGIPTYIKSEGRRGRRTEILIYHQNKNVQKLQDEIKQLPKSLKKANKLFNDSNCIITAPYLTLIMLAHILQFTLCINSLGSYSEKKIISDFRKNIGNSISILAKWGYRVGHLNRIRDLFTTDDDTGALEKISRGKVVEIQNELKDVYENNIKNSLHFPSLIPAELSPHF